MKEKNYPKIVIIGGGPTGLGAAYRLNELGYSNWVMYEKKDHFGGHSTTHTDKNGFKWDEGGHVIFSHYKYFDDFLKKTLKKDHYKLGRESWVVYEKNRVPYPFQNNVRYLDKDDQVACLSGLSSVQFGHKNSKDFGEWIHNTFGKGVAEKFMDPYNFKVWATPLNKMSQNWIEERVSVPNFERSLKNVISETDDVAWGPNNKFTFPKYGGTGDIYERAGKKMKKNIITGVEVVAISVKNKQVTLSNGEVVNYDYLISSMPLTELPKISKDLPDTVKKAALALTYNSLVVIGLGIKRKIETSCCWEYYPAEDVPFNRLTYFHNYSPDLVPESNIEKYSSLMLEVCYSKYKKVNKENLVEDSINSLIKYGILKETDRNKIISKTTYDIKYGYPIPTLDRDKLLKKIQPFLMKNGIYSRGRYGAWKYEISNMDHCFMQGVESVDNIIENKPEETWIP